MMATAIKNTWSRVAMVRDLNHPQRYRGFVLTTSGLQKLHQRVNQLEVQTRFRQSPRTIAERVQLHEPDGIHPITVRKILRAENGVDRRSLQLVFRVLQLQLDETDYAHAGLCQPPAAMPPIAGKPAAASVGSGSAPASAAPSANGPSSWQRPPDWSTAVDATTLCGRLEERSQLYRAMVTERCRLVSLWGMAGVGKTALATQLAKDVEPEFEQVVWRSLRHAPSLETLLADVLQALPQPTPQNLERPASAEHLIGRLIEQLQQNCCLLVLDHFDAVLCSQHYAGYCRQDYEAYGELLRVVAEVSHASCVMITIREKPRAIGMVQTRSVQSVYLSGLSDADSQQLIRSSYLLCGTPDEWQLLNQYYGGNPLALKAIAAFIQDYFNGQLASYLDYLKTGQRLFGDLRDLLSQQFERLSALEQKLVSRLALYPEPVSIAQFHADAMNAIHQQSLLEGMDSLSRRSLLRRQGTHISLDPLMQAFITECLIEQRDAVSPKTKLELVAQEHTVA